MNHETGDYCSVHVCSEQNGTMPACAGLAVPYVPCQQSNPETYSEQDALSSGTLYPSLNLPFHLRTDGSPLPNKPMTQLQALSFVVLELGHYLDTHPDDQEAFMLYRQYTELERTAQAAYETSAGPLTRAAAGTSDHYAWLDDPWPWDCENGEVK